MKQLYYVPLYTNSRDKIIDKCIDVLNQGKRFVYLLPSREAMFDTRNKFIEKFGGLIGTSNIFSFDNLERIIVKDELQNKTLIDSDTILILLKETCKKLELSNKLNFFGNVIDKNGFIDEIYRIIKNLRRQNISPLIFKEKCIQLSYRTNDISFNKRCIDIFNIYDEYIKVMNEKNLYDIDDISIKAIEMLEFTNAFNDVHLFVIDGYINIDKINKELFEAIVEYNQDINYIVNIPYNSESNNKFIDKELIVWLKKLGFENANTDQLEQIIVPKDIKLLSENLFSQKSKIIDTSECIKILNSPCIENEVRQSARIIKSKLMDEECTPDKIAIFINNISDYEEQIRDVFDEFNIPTNISFDVDVSSQPLIRDIMDLLKLENNLNSLEKLSDIMCSKYLLNQKELFENVGDSHLHFIGDCHRQIKEIINKFGIKKNIIDLYRENLIPAEVFIRDIKLFTYFENFVETLINSYSLCGLLNTEINFFDFLEILEESLSDKTIVINQGNISGVRIINTDLARGQHYDYVFILGVNEGIYPNLKENLIFCNAQNNLLFEEGINFNNQNYELYREKIRFDLACGSSQKELYISHRTSDEESGYMIKSAFLEDLEGLFSESSLKTVTSSKLYMRDRFEFNTENISTIKEARDFIFDSIWQNDAQSIDKYNSAINEEYKPSFKHINDAGKVELLRSSSPDFDSYDGRLDNPSLKQNTMNYAFSASQINNFIKCPFGYFLGRVLGMDTFDEDGELTAINEGRIYHKVLKDYYKDNQDIIKFDENRLNICIDDTFKIINNTKLESVVFDVRKSEIKEVLSNFLAKDIEYLVSYQKQTGNKMIPIYLEEQFVDNTSFNKSKFKGIIDRVDIEFDKENKPTGKFIIYDYKRSSASTLTDCIQGKDLQLAIYYYCLVQKLQNEYEIVNPECIGLLYYSIEKNGRDGIIRKDYKKQIGLGSKRNVVSKDKFIGVLEHLKSWTDNIIIRIQDGDYSLPYECDPTYCDYKTICRYDKYRIANKK